MSAYLKNAVNNQAGAYSSLCSCLQAVLNSTWIVCHLKPLDGLAHFGKLDVFSLITVNLERRSSNNG
ncbi:hypothetical protein HW132_06690 [Brasilonema sp. CT11]|nr:hypothetical protein [Brasilonema sp. CT11]